MNLRPHRPPVGEARVAVVVAAVVASFLFTSCKVHELAPVDVSDVVPDAAGKCLRLHAALLREGRALLQAAVARAAAPPPLTAPP